jgi:GTP-binding protein HflX
LDELKRAVVISLEPRPHELWELCSSLGLEVEETFVQKLPRPDPKGFVGAGKLKEVAAFAHDEGVDVCVFNGELSPSVMFHVESVLGTAVYDKVRLILEIFKRQAASEEARLQVEMAVLRQDLPVISEWVHKAKVGEHPGFMAGGEYDVRQYYSAQSRRQKELARKLEKLVKQRELRRRNRARLGLRTVSLAGYTNAGKTALMNALTRVDRPSEERLFTTLSTTTRRLKGPAFPVLVTDTIGFMEDLPPWLLESFRSTLEEVLNSDVMLLVVDASNPPREMARKLRTCAEVIWTVGSTATILPVFNKMDLVEKPQADGLVMGPADGQGTDREDGPETNPSLSVIHGKLAACLQYLEERGREVGDGKREVGPGHPGDGDWDGSGTYPARSLVDAMLGETDRSEEDGEDEGDEERMPSVLRPILVSARTEENLDELLERLGELVSPGDEVTVTLPARMNWRGMLNLLYDSDEVAVLDVEEPLGETDGARVRLNCEPAGLARTMKALERKFGAGAGVDRDRGMEREKDGGKGGSG